MHTHQTLPGSHSARCASTSAEIRHSLHTVCTGSTENYRSSYASHDVSPLSTYPTRDTHPLTAVDQIHRYSYVSEFYAALPNHCAPGASRTISKHRSLCHTHLCYGPCQIEHPQTTVPHPDPVA